MAFTYFFDFSSPATLSVTADLPPQTLLLRHCLAQLACSTHHSCRFPSLEMVLERAAAHHVVCLSADASFYQVPSYLGKLLETSGDVMAWEDGLLAHPVFRTIRSSMTISHKFRSAAQTIIQSLLQSLPSRGPKHKLVAIHARVEHDFQISCPFWARRSLKPGSPLLACFLPSDGILLALAKGTKTHGIDPMNTALLVMSGNATSVSRILCDAGSPFRHCLHKGTFFATYGEKKTLDLSDETSQAMLDYALSHSADFFVGNMYSTFSMEIAREFQNAGKPFFFYNTPCPLSGKCT